jgi:hypothetical protein
MVCKETVRHGGYFVVFILFVTAQTQIFPEFFPIHEVQLQCPQVTVVNPNGKSKSVDIVHLDSLPTETLKVMKR